MSAVRVTRHDSLRAMPPAWASVFREQEGQRQFDQTLNWFEVFESHGLAAGERVELCCVETAAQEPLLCLPLRAASARGLLAPRLAHSLASYYTSLFAPTCRVGTVDAAAFRAAVAATASNWDVLRLEPLDATDAMTLDLEAALRAAGFLTQRYFKFGNWYLEVGGRSFDEYFRDLPSQVRNTVVRKQKKLKSESTARVEIVTAAALLPAAIAAYEEVYASSWKTAEPFPHFVPRMMQAMAERGWLRLGLVWLGSVPIAAQIWIIKDGVASIFKLAYKEEHARLSAGSILTATLMRHALDVDRVKVVDYLTGDDAYKKDWMSHRRERIGIVAANSKSLAGLTYAARYILPGTLRRRLRRGVPATP